MQVCIVDMERLLHDTLRIYGGYITSPENISSDYLIELIELSPMIQSEKVFRALSADMLPFGLLARRLAERVPLDRMTSVIPGAPGKPWVFYID